MLGYSSVYQVVLVGSTYTHPCLFLRIGNAADLEPGLHGCATFHAPN